MLIVEFSIAADTKYAEEVFNTLDEFGVEILKEERYPKGPKYDTARVYYDCRAPFSRVKMLAKQLDEDTTKTTYLSY